MSVHAGDCIEWMQGLPDNSLDSCITDPPYELGFMGKSWDSTGIAFDPATWAEVLRVLKPGSHLLAFGGTRTVHRIAVAIEDAGFEIRDTLHWCYWSGFPKSLDVSKSLDALHGAEREVVIGRGHHHGTGGGAGRTTGQWAENYQAGDAARGSPVFAPATEDARKWAGFGTAVKPAIEPAILARKPLSESSIARNVLRWGTGALNVDGCRFRPGDVMWPGPQDGAPTLNGRSGEGHRDWFDTSPQVAGPSATGARFPANLLHCPKASRAERELGCEGLPTTNGIANIHSTVKPTRLMRYLCRLVTPPGGTVLDPFSGSGTCGCAAALEGFGYVGAELEGEYVRIARSRNAHARAYPTSWAHTAPGYVGDASDEVEMAVKAGQLGMFG